MANSKISALTSATTPLAGTETLPIVQSGATVKATVANIVGAGTSPGSFTSLNATGNTTLGDATTDTVTVNGYMGLGGSAPNSAFGIYATPSALTGTFQIGGLFAPTGTSSATVAIRGLQVGAATAAAVFTVADVSALLVQNITKGAGSTITNAHGINIGDLTNGTNNFGITSSVSSGTNKWNIYASGTAQNGFAGNVRIGSVVAPTVALDVTGAVKVSTTITPLDNIIQGTAAKGINFTANTPAAGMTSQLLNWYEEGTWTPNQGAGLTVVGAFSSSGRYTRIGRLVTVHLSVSGATTVAGASGGVITSNLPFTTAGVTPVGSATNNTPNASSSVQGGGTTIYLATAIPASAFIYATLTYQTS